MSRNSRTLIIPRFQKTVVTAESDPAGKQVDLPNGEHYYVVDGAVEGERARPDNKAKWAASNFETYPIVVRGDGSPWDEANLFIFSLLENAPEPNMGTAIGLAGDLVAYSRFLEDVPLGEQPIQWSEFPRHRNLRPTYRYRGYLSQKTWLGEIAPSTAKRRMSAVVRFYRWLLKKQLITPEVELWKDREKLISVPNDYGKEKVLRVQTTDLSIRVPEQKDPYDGTIEDEGRLCPLPPSKQDWVIEALESLGNTEMTLIHVFALLTGARIQTVLTTKLKHVLVPAVQAPSIILPVGPGTGIDTKNDKKSRLHIPAWFMECLNTYAMSARAERRRKLAVQYEPGEQYLFLSIRGAPMYLGKQDKTYRAAKKLRYGIFGQAVRQYMKDHILPFIRAKYDPQFSYRFHDLRASYGMNIVDHFAPQLAAGEITYTDVLRFVSSRLGHASFVTTERYLQFRKNQSMVGRVQDQWEARLQGVVHRGIFDEHKI